MSGGCVLTSMVVLLRVRLTQPMTTVSLGLTLSTIVAPPLAAGLMSIDAGGLKGWQVGGVPLYLHTSVCIFTKERVNAKLG